jgi:protein-S-isoprenylcysteine O-methyltransferase Ste14
MIPFIIIWSFWFLSEVLLNRLLRSGAADKKELDNGSRRLIWITIGIANTSAVICTLLVPVTISHILLIPYIGLFVIIAGMVIRFMAVWSLGRFFTVDVTIREDHRLKNDGMYRIIRHPSYTGSLVSFLGFGISLNNWISLIILVLLVTSTMLYRIKIEERVLSDQFGEEYKNYMKNTWRLIPWIF